MKYKRLRHMGEEVKAKKTTSSGVRMRAREECAREKHRSAQRDHKVKGGADDAALLSGIVRFFSARAALGLHRRAVSHRASASLSVVYRTDTTNGTNSAPKHLLLPHETGKAPGQIQHFSVNPSTGSVEIL